MLAPSAVTAMALPVVPKALPKLDLLEVSTLCTVLNALPKLGLPDAGIRASSSNPSPSLNALPKLGLLDVSISSSSPNSSCSLPQLVGIRARAKDPGMKAAFAKQSKKTDACAKQGELKGACRKRSKVTMARAKLAFRTASGVLVSPGSTWKKLMGLNLFSSELPASFLGSSSQRGEHGDTRDDVMEMFAPPRLLKITPEYGLKGAHSIDLQTGYDLIALSGQARASSLLASKNPRFLMVCPPCQA